MSWLWFALIPVAFWLHRKWNKKINREERKSYGLSPNSKEDFIGSWGVTQRFLHYLDFNVDVYNTYNHILVIRNPRGESFTFMEPLTDTIVQYKQNDKLIEEWKFPFWVHPNRAFETIDKYYKSTLKPNKIEEKPTNKWTEKCLRPFTFEEIECVESTLVVGTKYGNSLQFNLKGGDVKYMPLEPNDEIKVGDSLNLKDCFIVTFTKPEEKDIYRVRFGLPY